MACMNISTKVKVHIGDGLSQAGPGPENHDAVQHALVLPLVDLQALLDHVSRHHRCIVDSRGSPHLLLRCITLK